MQYTLCSVTEWMEAGYDPIHLIGDYYLLRQYPVGSARLCLYSLAKIRDTPPPLEQCTCGSEPKLFIHKEPKKLMFIVKCPNCNAMAGGYSYGACVNPSEAMRRWNKSIRDEKGGGVIK